MVDVMWKRYPKQQIVYSAIVVINLTKKGRHLKMMPPPSVQGSMLIPEECIFSSFQSFTGSTLTLTGMWSPGGSSILL